MSRYCKICGRSRANEKFGGRGMRRFICSDCRRLPKAQQLRALWTDEVLGFLDQSNISAKNLKRLREIENAEIEPVRFLAAFVRRVAELKPHKKRRWKWLAANHPGLIQQARYLGLLEDLPPQQPYDQWEYVNVQFDWAAVELSADQECDSILD